MMNYSLGYIFGETVEERIECAQLIVEACNSYESNQQTIKELVEALAYALHMMEID